MKTAQLSLDRKLYIPTNLCVKDIYIDPGDDANMYTES